MRILLVSDFYSPTSGGLEAHVTRLKAELVRRGHDVLVLTVGQDSSSDNDEAVRRTRLTLQSLPRIYQSSDRAFTPPWPDSALLRAIGTAIDDFKPDIVHAHGWCGIAAGRAATPRHVPVVVTLHDYGLLCPLKTLERGNSSCVTQAGVTCVRCPGASQGLGKRVALAGALRWQRSYGAPPAAFIAVSDHVAARHARANINPIPVVIPNFIEDPPDDATPAPAAGPILFVGSEAPNKGMASLIAAYCELPTHLAPGLRIVGGQVRTGVRPDIVHVGRLSGERLWDEYRSALVVAVPSQWHDPCPTVALEAMRFARPVVATDVGGLRDMVQHGSTGLLVARDDTAELTGALALAVSNPVQSARWGSQARAQLHRFTSSAVVPQIEALYERVTKGVHRHERTS